MGREVEGRELPVAKLDSPESFHFYHQIVFAACAVFFLELVRSIHYYRSGRSRLSQSFLFLCFSTFVYAFLFWFRLTFPGVVPFIHMRHLNWIVSLIANTYYLETLGAYLEIKNRFFLFIKNAMYFFVLLFLGFEIHYLLTGSSLLFSPLVRPDVNLFNVMAGVHTSTSTPLLVGLSGTFAFMLLGMGIYFMILAFRAPEGEWMLKIGITLSFLSVLNELLNAAGLIESVSLIFLTKGLEIFRISEFLARLRYLKLQKLEAEVSQLSKRAATAFIASGLMHDLRSPLTVLVAYISKVRWASRQMAQIAGSGNESDFEVVHATLVKAADKMGLQTQRLQAIITSYLDLIRESKNQSATQTCELADLINEAMELSAPRLAVAGIDRLVIDPIPDSKINCVKVQVEMIFANILNNALEAVKGRVQGWVRVGFDRQVNRVIVRVSNSGAIAPEVLHCIQQDEGITTKGLDGYGIGLRIVSELCRANQAELHITTENECTHIWVSLPVTEAPSLVRVADLLPDQGTTAPSVLVT